MNNQLVQNILRVLAGLEQLEKNVAQLYELAAQKWPVDADIWTGLSGDEIKHADCLKSMAAILEKNPGYFEAGRPINIAAVNSSMAWISKAIDDITADKFDYRKMIFFARDIEQSILESKYSEILKTNNAEYNKLAKQVVGETVSHKKKIDDLIAKQTG